MPNQLFQTGQSGTQNSSMAIRPRGYQLEMLEASLKENIIVAMDTGSGKTQVAVMRIKAELETCAPTKLVWFLAPTIALVFQQQEVIKSQIQAQTRALTSLDNVDRWTDQSVWNKALKGIRIVVSTHAVLSDALAHGFVQMSQLALLVFDEAHHCMRRHPANKIMQTHYHPRHKKYGPDAVPKILGLTASPIRSNENELAVLEANLDAVCKTPRVNRTELLECVHRPHLHRLIYNLPKLTTEEAIYSDLLIWLESCVDKYNIHDDPYIDFLRQNPDTLADAQELAVSGKTFCKEQLDKFLERSMRIFIELGGWATDFFIEESIVKFRDSIGDDNEFSEINRSERLYLLDILSGMPACKNSGVLSISPKLATLIDYLVEEDDRSGLSAIIFAQTRAVVTFLARVLSIHPKMQDHFRTASYVGWSSYQNRSDSLGDIASRDIQRDTLAEFRTGKKNLIVATDVLEEGLDISSCRLVVCFDRPANLKSFVQRRGRARRQESTYAIMSSTKDELDVAKWQELESLMIRTYQDDERQRKEAERLENLPEQVERRLFVSSTNACLTADESKQHLYHFCSVLPSPEDTDNSPIFAFKEGSTGLVQASVVLPSSVHPAVRQAQGQNWWKTERAATKEVAFIAYEALWKYGLVNDNLLPATQKTHLEMSNAMLAPIQASSVLGAGQFDPYVPLARAWATSGQCYRTVITFSINGIVDDELTLAMVLPMNVPMPAPIHLYWSLDRQILVEFSAPEPLTGITPEHIVTMQQITSVLLNAPSSKGGKEKKEDYVVPFVPAIHPDQLKDWLNEHDGTEVALDLYNRTPNAALSGFIRDTSLYAEARLFLNWIIDPIKKSISMECQSLPQRRNLLNPATMYHESKIGGPPALAPKIQILPVTGCTSSKLPAKTGIVGRFFSAILDRFEATLVAQELSSTILRGVEIQDISHVLTAITMPIAQARTDYQVYEFFGDSVLKFTVGCQLFYADSTWQENRLSTERDKLISNANLTKSALMVGLDAYILADRFTPTSWSAPSISEKLSTEKPRRQLANKVIADVVEALIGAAYMDGGMSKAQKCLYRFMPEVDIMQGGLPTPVLDPQQKANNPILPSGLQNLIGYEFNDTSLVIEALTHASGSHNGSQSYNRLEYLGDAVLDIIIVSTLASLPQKIPQGQMTLLKHASTNGNMLAFLCMNHSVTEYQEDGSTTSIHLYDYLRYNGDVVSKSRSATLSRFEKHRSETIAAFNSSPSYPWLLLSQIHADKFFSDIIESLIGAIFVDSGGDLSACSSFASSLGILDILSHFITDSIDVQHPRNKAQSIMKEERMVEFKITGSPNAYICTARYGPKKGPLLPIEIVTDVAFREEAEIRAAYKSIPTLIAKEAENKERDERTRLERIAHRQRQSKARKKRKKEAKSGGGEK